MRPSTRLIWVGLFAIGFGYVESAVVTYLRQLYGVSDLMLDIHSFDPMVALIETGREVATLVMLLLIGWIAGRTRQARLGFTLVAFGVWDITYYLWLKLFIDWPASLLEPDILFLIPLPWWGPVLSPVLIAGLMILGGVLAVTLDDRGHRLSFRPVEWGSLAIGIIVVLYTFMADSLAALPATPEALSQLRPTDFNWPIYLIGLALMTWPVIRFWISRGRVEEA